MLLWTFRRRRLKIAKPQKKNSSYYTHKEEARMLILSQLDFFNQDNMFIFNRVAIRDQKRCWGSCSSKGNLNFSYKLLFLPPCLRDYIIVHELCHLNVLNHSANFWGVVLGQMPDYKRRMLELRILERSIGTSITALKKYQLLHTCPSCAQEKAYLK